MLSLLLAFESFWSAIRLSPSLSFGPTRRSCGTKLGGPNIIPHQQFLEPTIYSLWLFRPQKVHAFNSFRSDSDIRLPVYRCWRANRSLHSSTRGLLGRYTVLVFPSYLPSFSFFSVWNMPTKKLWKLTITCFGTRKSSLPKMILVTSKHGEWCRQLAN